MKRFFLTIELWGVALNFYQRVLKYPIVAHI